MPGFRGYSLYRGIRLYVPREDELSRDQDGRYRVNAVISMSPHSRVELVQVPDCLAANLDEAIGLSMTYAMRLAENGWCRSTDDVKAVYTAHSVAA